MRRLVLATLLLCSLLPASAFADTIIGLVPNDGSGDNFGFRTYGPGYNISGEGGIPADTFSEFPPGYAPGSTLVSTRRYFSRTASRSWARSHLTSSSPMVPCS